MEGNASFQATRYYYFIFWVQITCHLQGKCYFPLKINNHQLKQQFYLDKHCALQMSEMPECMPHCFGHLPVTVALLCWWQSQLTPRLYHLKQFLCSSVCDKANFFVNFSCIQEAHDKTAKCNSNLWQSSRLLMLLTQYNSCCKIIVRTSHATKFFRIN